MKSALRSVPLLYLVFVLSLVHLGYFLLHQQKENMTFFVLIATFVYLIFPNMIVVLASAMVSVDVISLARREGFDASMNMDPSGVMSMDPLDSLPTNDLSGNPLNLGMKGLPFSGAPEGMPFTKGLPLGVSSTGVTSGEPFTNGEPTQYLETFVKGLFKKEAMSGNDIGEVQALSTDLDQKIKHTQASSPELDTKLNVAEFNTLMSRLNTMIGTITD